MSFQARLSAVIGAIGVDIKSLVSAKVDSTDTRLTPPGVVIFTATVTPPSGYLKANGAAVSRITYGALFSAIGTSFGVGDGSTTFNLPDLRGEFIRGWDDARGIDAGRSFGSAQADLIKNHTHALTQQLGAGTVASGSSYYGTVSSSSNTGSVSSGGGAESRPRNVALLACIKY